jgi:hypothetical protein
MQDAKGAYFAVCDPKAERVFVIQIDKLQRRIRGKLNLYA